MFVIPEWNMVIVRLGLDQNQRAITDAVYSHFLEKVGQALMEGPASKPRSAASLLTEHGAAK